MTYEIRSEHEYAVTVRQLHKFRETREEVAAALEASPDDVLLQAQLDGVESMIDELETQIAIYDGVAE